MKKHILVVEPDSVLASVFQKLFESNGYSVALATTAQEAIMKSDEQLPDLVLLEPRMARHNGVEFLYEFRSYTEWQHIPVGISTMSAAANMVPRSLQKEFGIAFVVDKLHTSLAQILERVESVLLASATKVLQ